MICTAKEKVDILESNCEAIDSSCPLRPAFLNFLTGEGSNCVMMDLTVACFSKNWSCDTGTIKDTNNKIPEKLLVETHSMIRIYADMISHL